MKYLVATLFVLILNVRSFAQGFADYIAENAIEIVQDKNLDSLHYKAFNKFDLIMVGEMHGTQEPALLVQKLAELTLLNQGVVSIGMEIPNKEIQEFLKSPNDSILRRSSFFTSDNIDGRNGQAWFDLLTYCGSDPRISLFFFDNSYELNIGNRDSVMYLGIKNQMTNYPESKIITLSGNIHSRLIPYNGSPTMGSYCRSDSLTFLRDRICSVNHVYSEGTLMNNMGNGLELRTVDFEKSIFSESTDLLNYLVFYETAEPSQNNCILYTQRVNHSEPLQQVELLNKSKN